MDDLGQFEAVPQSPRANKTAHGGGLSLVLNLSENEFKEWTKLAALRGQNLVFTYTLSPHQPAHPLED